MYACMQAPSPVVVSLHVKLKLEQFQALAALAKRLKTTRTDLVRDGVEHVLKKHEVESP